MIVEATVVNDEGQDQGSVLLYVIAEAEGFGSLWCKCVGIQDAYYLWWVREAGGHPDPGLRAPVFVPFDPAAGGARVPPVVEVGSFRILYTNNGLNIAEGAGRRNGWPGPSRSKSEAIVFCGLTRSSAVWRGGPAYRQLPRALGIFCSLTRSSA